mgnify:CR=1 FL=1
MVRVKMIMKKRGLMWIFLLIVAVYSVSASNVTRDFSSGIIDQGSTVDINLTVDITGSEGYYIIDDLIPAGMTITDTGTGNTNDAGHIKWFVSSGVADTVLSYTLEDTDNSIRTVQFNGTYIFESDHLNEYQILGQQSLDICTPSLANTTWSAWSNISCLDSYYMNQSRSAVQYDANSCGTYTNNTVYEYRQTEQCYEEADTDYDYAISNLELSAYAHRWFVNSSDVTSLQLADVADMWFNGGAYN